MTTFRRALRTCLMVLAATGCANPGQFVWIQNYPERPSPSQNDADYVIAVGDTVGVRVYEQDSVSMRGRVRADGKISVALVGDVPVAGKHPAEVASDVANRLKQYIKDPSVTVSVEEVRPISVSVMGEVAHAGIFQLDASAGVLEALAAAGGPTEFADRNRVFVLRRAPGPVRIRFTYEALIHNESYATAFTLKTGDTVVVE